MYYIAVVKDDLSRYAEHYETEEGLKARYPGLYTQSLIEGEGWSLYVGGEPWEVARMRLQTPFKEGEDMDEYEARLKDALKHAFDSSISKLTPTMLDDRPEWFKKGFPTEHDWKCSLSSGTDETSVLQSQVGG